MLVSITVVGMTTFLTREKEMVCFHMNWIAISLYPYNSTIADDRLVDNATAYTRVAHGKL